MNRSTQFNALAPEKLKIGPVPRVPSAASEEVLGKLLLGAPSTAGSAGVCRLPIPPRYRRDAGRGWTFHLPASTPPNVEKPAGFCTRIARPAADCAWVLGYLRVSRGECHFAFDDGSSYFAVGANICWSRPRGTYDSDQLFRRRLHRDKDPALKVRRRGAS